MCKIPHCRNDDVEVVYQGKDICAKHWDMFCNKEINLKGEVNEIAKKEKKIGKVAKVRELLADGIADAVIIEKTGASKGTVSVQKYKMKKEGLLK